jgi:folate-binding protein YgfZ
VDGIEAEYAAITAACGVLPRSERGKLALTGTESKAFLQGQVSNDVESLSPGRGCYAVLLTPKGKMLGDLRILDAGHELLLDTERVALQALFDMIRRYSIGYDVQLHKRTLECGLMSLLGPSSEAACESLVGAVPGEHEHDHVAADGVRAIRTDVGIDLLYQAPRTESMLEGLRKTGVELVGEAAAEVLRIERGRPRYGVDLDDGVIPQEAGLNERAVSFTKGCYVGQETVARLFYRGKPNRHLRGLRAPAPLAAGAELSYRERAAGRVTSAAVSPAFGPIALAFVRREVPVGALVLLENGAGGAEGDGGAARDRGAGEAEVVELPFR